MKPSSGGTGRALLRREELQRRLTSLLSSYGYSGIDTPLLEPTELFLRKSGGELASQLFSFTDPGSRAVSLRPEFTAPAMRHFLENAEHIDLPVRWQYCGPVFRFDGTGASSAGEERAGGQFTQIGGELLGSSSVMADVELLELALSVLAESGLSRWTLRLADLNILNCLLAPLDLSDRARAFAVQSAPQLGDGKLGIPELMERARRLHLIGHLAEDDYLSQAVNGLDDGEARTVLLGVLRSNPLDQLGQRRPEEVVERLLRKIRRPDAEQTLRLALESVARLARIRGEPLVALKEAANLLQESGADRSATARLEKIYGLLPARDDARGHVVLDLGLVRGLAYYNGIIFEVSHPDWPTALGGGGRYDGLARDLGSRNRLPALGFAYNLDALVQLNEDDSIESRGDANGVLLVAEGEGSQSSAIDVARSMRASGRRVETDVSGRSLEEVRAYAARRGFAQIAIVADNGGLDVQDV